MRDENELTAAQKSTEAALAGLRPAAPGIGPDALMFRAGRAAGIRQVRRWQAAASTLGVLLLVAMIFPRATPTPRIVYVDRIMPAATAQANQARETPAPPENIHLAAHRPSALAYLSLRDDVLSHGVDALPSPAAEPEHVHQPRPAPERAFTPPPVQRRAGTIETLGKLLEVGDGS